MTAETISPEIAQPRLQRLGVTIYKDILGKPYVRICSTTNAASAPVDITLFADVIDLADLR